MQITIEQFSGPLDALLGMIEQKDLPITEVSIGDVTDQYVQFVEQLDDDDADQLADFLVIASKLLLMKARQLLPQFFPEEEDEESLEEQLRLYKAFVEAAKTLNTLWEQPTFSRFRSHPAPKAAGFIPPEALSAVDLRISMVKLISRLKPHKPLPQVKIDSTVSLKEKIKHIKKIIATGKRMLFHETMSDQRNKSEIIVGFLALLELVKQKTVTLEQDATFGDIVIEKA
ncbi:MAG: segregation/condensation protein A [Candidatus Magasanikbacteria bacterium]|jgi:segregation and condensation protein A|nr:segregation/condensation protein A [Candidatus Magasanikbacteria bacterium]